MGRRQYPCQCCADVTPCNKCNEGPVQFVIDVEYGSGSGVMIEADAAYGDISTTCTPDDDFQCVTLVRVTDGGSGYTSPPAAVFSGGDPGDPPVAWVTIDSPIDAVNVTAGGSYTSRPGVTINAPGGSTVSAAELYAELNAAVETVAVTQQGSGYTEPPTVHFHRGGGGSGAAATATISGGRVTAVTVTGGGSGYTYPPDVSFSGGGGSGAVATAAIRGPVARVVVVNPGRYRASSFGPINFPTLSFGSGGAAATITWNGAVTAVDVSGGCDGSDFDSPTITFTGGGGSGATATAYQAAAETLVVDIADGCGASETNEVGFNYASSNGVYPLNAASLPARSYFELARISAVADVSMAAKFATNAPSNALVEDWFFGREAIWMTDVRQWSASVSATVDGQERKRLHIKQNAARVTPHARFELSGQPAAASQALLQATWESDTDVVGRNVWRLAGATIVRNGRNLLIPKGMAGDNQARLEYVEGNLFPGAAAGFLALQATYSYSAPVALASVSGFAVQPQINFTFTPTSEGIYTLSSASVVNGGRAAVGGPASGTVSVTLTMDRGYVRSAPVVTATLSGGVVQSVSVVNGGSFDGPARLESVVAPEEPLGRFAGVGFTTMTTTYAAPDIQARPLASSGNSGAELAVTLTQDTDENGLDFWSVASVQVVRGGRGYNEDVPIVFWLGTGSVEALPAVAFGTRPARTAPTIRNWTLTGGSEAELAFTISSSGAGQWSISAVDIIDGGFGYANGSTINLTLGDDDQASTSPVLTIAVDDEGTITAVTITNPGVFWHQSTAIESVTVVRGGRYYKRTQTETEIPIDVDCTTGAWQVLEYPVGEGFDPQVGDEFERQFVSGAPPVSTFVDSTRRCPLPTVTLSLQ